MIWNETKECMSRDEMRSLQSKRLVKLVDRVYHNVEFYRKKMQALGIEPGDTLLILGKHETGLIVTKPETLNDLATRIFQSVENEE